MKKGLPLLLSCIVFISIMAGFLYDQNQSKIRYQQQYRERESKINDENTKSDPNLSGYENREYDDDPKYDVNNSNNENIQQETQTQRQWVNCNECHGSGVKECYSCHGSGQKECRRCFGDGVIDKGTIFSPDTNGRGHTCPECGGRGNKKCTECYGKGNNGNCFRCEGRGQVQM